jgi:uncharacterized membrane protein (UPF0127 family)
MKPKKYEEFSFKYQGRKLKIKAKTCKGFWKKFTGKMFTSDEKPIIFEFRNQILVKIHMLFVFMPLLVVWFDKNKKVTKIKILKPFTSFEEAEGKYVLEIPLKNKLIRDFEHMEC